MTTETHLAIKQLLETHNTMTLATCLDDKPWAATVFYVSDSELNLYFVSDQRTRHGRHLQTTAWAAGAINADCSNWSEICGVQFEGHVTVLEGLARVSALSRYFLKFPDVKSLFEQPKNPDEERIASCLLAAQLYKLSPERMRLIDNRQQFGYKSEIMLNTTD